MVPGCRHSGTLVLGGDGALSLNCRNNLSCLEYKSENHSLFQDEEIRDARSDSNESEDSLDDEDEEAFKDKAETDGATDDMAGVAAKENNIEDESAKKKEQ